MAVIRPSGGPWKPRHPGAQAGRLKPITLHWSGCPAGVAITYRGYRTAWQKARVGGKVVDAVDIFVGERSGPGPEAGDEDHGRCAVRQTPGGPSKT